MENTRHLSNICKWDLSCMFTKTKKESYTAYLATFTLPSSAAQQGDLQGQRVLEERCPPHMHFREFCFGLTLPGPVGQMPVSTQLTAPSPGIQSHPWGTQRACSKLCQDKPKYMMGSYHQSHSQNTLLIPTRQSQHILTAVCNQVARHCLFNDIKQNLT